MANTRFTQFFYTKHTMPTLIDFNFVVGATGAVGTTKGPGISSVTRLAVGTYQVKLQDNYNKFFGHMWSMEAPVTGANIADGSFVVGTVYEITAVGTTDWQAAGLPVGLTPTVGQVFKAATVGGAGTGTVKALGSSGVFGVESLGLTNTMLAPQGYITGIKGGYVTLKCIDAAGAAVDPTAGSKFYAQLYLGNGSSGVNE